MDVGTFKSGLKSFEDFKKNLIAVEKRLSEGMIIEICILNILRTMFWYRLQRPCPGFGHNKLVD